MAYTSGNTILDDHYNLFATGNANGTANNSTNNVNRILGTGTGVVGYGQTNTLAPASAGAVITATQWSNLLNRISSLASHQGSSINAITNPTTGNLIQALATLQGNVNTVNGNRRNAVSSGSSIVGTNVMTSTWTAGSYPRLKVTFASANHARYFFNAGGLVKVTMSRSGGSSHSKNAEWTDLCNKVGTFVFSNGEGTSLIAGTNYTGTNKIGGGGTVNSIVSTFGFHDLSTGYTQVFKQFADTSPYTANYISHHVRSQNSGTAVEFAVNCVDAAADTSIPPGLDIVDGTLTMTLTVVRPSTTYLTNTWGTPVITNTGSSQS